MIALLLLLSCTDNQRAKVLGGSMAVQAPCDQQIFDVTWKGENLWYATQPAPVGWVHICSIHEFFRVKDQR